MASQGDPEAAEIVSIYWAIFVTTAIEIASIALLTYEGILTLRSEVALFWRRRWTGATALFLFTKYMMLLDYNILGAITFAPLSDQSCAAMLKAQAMVSCLIYLPWAVFSALRVLALSGMNWFLAVLTFALSVVPTAMNLWPYSEGPAATTILNFGLSRRVERDGSGSQTVGIHSIATITLARHRAIRKANYTVDVRPSDRSLGSVRGSLTPLPALIASRTCLIVADLLVVAVTWRATFKTTRLTRDMTDTSMNFPSVTEILFRNGTSYFLIIATLNLLQITLTYARVIGSNEVVSYVTLITDPMTAVLICRFLLDLQAAKHGMSVDGDSQTLANSSAGGESIVFARVIGSIGGSLAVPERGEGEDVKEEE